MKRILYTLAALLGMAITSCEHKDLCYNHPEHSPKTQVNIVAQYEQEWQYTYEGATDWETQWPAHFPMKYDNLRPEIPSGLRVMSYHQIGDEQIHNLPTYGGLLSLREGENDLLFYNNDTEYIVFDEMASYASARATTRSRSRNTYLGNSFYDSKATEENTVNAPDMLYGNYREGHYVERTTEAPTLEITMHPLVFTYVVRYEFSKGLQYVGLARGALAGMAESVYLNNGRTSPEAATILYDCTLEKFGAQALVNSFGVPNYPNENYSRVEGSYALNLEVMLKNGNMKTFEFDVTDQVKLQPHGGVIVVKDLEVTDEEGKAGGSGFNVSVNGWGEYEDIELPLL